jgi:hypothetical protein
VLKAGTNVFYANGGARNAVNTPIDPGHAAPGDDALLRQNAKRITSVVKSTPDYRTEPVEAAFIGAASPRPRLGHPQHDRLHQPEAVRHGDAVRERDRRGRMVRYLNSTVFAPFADAGGAKGAMRSTSGTSADVYPILFLARDAFGIVPLKGKDALTPMVVNPKPAAGDPLGAARHGGLEGVAGRSHPAGRFLRARLKSRRRRNQSRGLRPPKPRRFNQGD